MTQYVVDRFEGDLAVLVSKEGSEIRNVERSSLPDGVTTGWTVSEEGELWFADPEDTAARKEKVREKMAQVFKR